MSPIDLMPITLLEQLTNKLSFSIIAAGWVVFILLVVWLVDVLFLKKWDIKNQLREGNRAVAIVLGAFIIGMCILASSANGATPTKQYDKYFQRYTNQYWGALVDWRLFKSQGLTESLLDRNARSPVGAAGIMQFMPATARDFRINPHSPRQSIDAGIRYMRQLYNQFAGRPRPHMDKMALAAASYNWGLGNVVRKAQPCAAARTGRDLLWADVRGCLPEETRLYWPRIIRWFSRLLVGG